MGWLRRKLDLLAKAIPVFLFAFAVFFGVGFLTGWDGRERKARDAVYSGLAYGVNEDGAPVLHLYCKRDGTAYDYLVGSNRRIPGVEGLKAEWLGNPSEENLALRTAILAFLGGPIGGVTAKSIIDALNKAKQQPRWPYLVRLIAGILGGISGYTVGYWQGSTWAIGCDSDLGRHVLANEDYWRLAEKLYFHISVIELELSGSAKFFTSRARNVNPLDDDPLFICKTKFATVSRELQRIGDPGEGNFRRLRSLIAAYQSAKDSAEYLRVDRLKISHVLVTVRGVDPDSALAKRGGYSPEAFAEACADLDAEVSRSLD